ncbi:MAG TPA: class I SAM-dependent methyltransferase [Phycisphaerae bacterium]|nr:class I SAM-dependent methyltransferase [Phycisphaerae bacterium]HOJ54652.1 class I SAM-dependent methyltransferase [Phycisphaerae bacterium]HOL27278.1 class I SAM-dependent methyltransferase [Phycisphaerae bacterium]HPP21079.1 class I SAM-dependent methyltransferase [Phycisphaerae bacterium]HPU33040.1 class I SAM-dependent methyltransferase [Phycisphaerae bacterium]
MSCPICRADGMSVFFELPDVPVHCNVLCATREEALAVPRGDIRLGFCRSCGLISNLAFEPARMAYGGRYENSLHVSPRFQQYAEELAARLIETYELRGRYIIEIACGQGEFLRLLCRLGNNWGTGFDPSYVPGLVDGKLDRRVKFVTDYYSEEYAGLSADLVCCRHALEHIADPVKFLRMVRRNVYGQRCPVLFFEVPNALFTLRQNGFWDILYEHCTYFTPICLERVFKQSGFQVLEVREEFGGQFVTIEARCTEGSGPAVESGDREDQELSRLSQDVETFSQRYRLELEGWHQRLAGLREQGRRVVTWGSGSKGTMFLNALQGCGGIEYVVDINPRKQGMFVPASGQQIVDPHQLQVLRPDVVLVMNRIYEDEIRRRVLDMNLRLQVLSV